MRRDMVVQMKIFFPPCCDESNFLPIRIKRRHGDLEEQRRGLDSLLGIMVGVCFE